MKKLLTYVIVTSFIMVLFPYTAFAAVPALSGSVENGVLTVTVSGVSSRTYPQVIVLSKNKDDESDFYLDTINLAKGQKTVKHTNVSGKTYILTAILKRKTEQTQRVRYTEWLKAFQQFPHPHPPAKIPLPLKPIGLMKAELLTIWLPFLR